MCKQCKHSLGVSMYPNQSYLHTMKSHVQGFCTLVCVMIVPQSVIFTYYEKLCTGVLYIGVCVIIASQSVFEYISTVSYIYTKDMTF